MIDAVLEKFSTKNNYEKVHELINNLSSSHANIVEGIFEKHTQNKLYIEDVSKIEDFADSIQELNQQNILDFRINKSQTEISIWLTKYALSHPKFKELEDFYPDGISCVVTASYGSFEIPPLVKIFRIRSLPYETLFDIKKRFNEKYNILRNEENAEMYLSFFDVEIDFSIDESDYDDS